MADPVNCGIEINSIVQSIKVHSYDAHKAKPVRDTEPVAEINSAYTGLTAESIFGGVDLPENENTESLDINNLFC